MKALSRMFAALLSSLLGVLGVSTPPSRLPAEQVVRPQMTDVALLEYLTGEVALAGPRSPRGAAGRVGGQ